MQVIGIVVNSLNDPTEVNTWFNNNPGIQLRSVVIENNVFYLFYE